MVQEDRKIVFELGFSYWQGWGVVPVRIDGHALMQFNRLKFMLWSVKSLCLNLDYILCVHAFINHDFISYLLITKNLPCTYDIFM